ncbi:uncharacterized protein LOC143577131 [Bidens hawaiensis]|uniref:uncharacterized protein LOC143577131 n=1 Tax=Bidens hawaiensis TaxID=980011 RepID=UPI00404B5C58
MEFEMSPLVDYNQGYYLADGIYPEWSTLVKSFKYPHTDEAEAFKKHHESARKDVERAFRVLQSRWHIIKGHARIWSIKTISYIMFACIILHNVIVHDEGEFVTNWTDEVEVDVQLSISGPSEAFAQRMERYKHLRNKDVHHILRHDLVQHICANMQLP